MEKLEMLYEGKAKKVYQTEDPNLYIVEYKDDATAFNGEKKGSIAGKGVINNKMTNIVFQYLENNGIQEFQPSVNVKSLWIIFFSICPSGLRSYCYTASCLLLSWCKMPSPWYCEYVY